MEMQLYQKVELVIEQQYGVKIIHKNQVEEYAVSKTHAVLSRCKVISILDKLLMGAARNLGANAEPHKNIVVVNDYRLSGMLTNIEAYTNVLLHEVGHIQDYKDRGRFKFWISAISSIPTKIRCSKYKGMQMLDMYYSTDIEKKANAYSNLDYRSFIF